MSYYVRLMHREHVVQVTRLDREAFPTMWPAANYERELENRLARYIVACDENRTVEEPQADPPPERGFARLALRLKGLFNHDRFFGTSLPPSGKEYIVGFSGIWVVADEAHITNIAVQETYRRQGIGEFLLICVIDLAAKLNARFITLEVRISNYPAQSLYRKYGFTQVGVRRQYYTDDHEDAMLMSTEDITAAPFQVQLYQRKQEHAKRWGIPLYEIMK